MQIFQSRSEERKAGEVFDTLVSEVTKSSLGKLVGDIAKGLTAFESGAIASACSDLGTSIAKAMENASDKHLATFEGSFGVELQQSTNAKDYSSNDVNTTLKLVVV